MLQKWPILLDTILAHQNSDIFFSANDLIPRLRNSQLIKSILQKPSCENLAIYVSNDISNGRKVIGLSVCPPEGDIAQVDGEEGAGGGERPQEVAVLPSLPSQVLPQVVAPGGRGGDEKRRQGEEEKRKDLEEMRRTRGEITRPSKLSSTTYETCLSYV